MITKDEVCNVQTMTEEEKYRLETLLFGNLSPVTTVAVL